MKNRIFKSIFALVLAFVALPIAANDYLKIYFKDGHTERHYMKLVDNISVTKYDLEGNLHSDYQMQQIVMADTTYSYYLSDIESMTFTKVYEEQVKKDVETVRNTVTPIFEQCSTVEEMEEHINEIKNVAGVEDAYRSGTDIFVKVRDWHDMVFMYPIVPEDDSNPFENMAKSLRNIKRKVPLKEDGTRVKVAVAYQLINDSREIFQKQAEDLRDLTDKFNEMGFDADFIPGEKGGTIDLDFFGKRMFEYDHVIFVTHGGYNEDTGMHGFCTSEDLDISAPAVTFWNWVDEHLDKKYGLYGIEPLRTDIDDTYIGTCRTGYLSSSAFVCVYQNYIGKYSPGFGNGPHIVFNGACNSLSGKGELTRVHNGVAKTYTGGSSAVADIFFNKGADIYMGYINQARYSGYTANRLFNHMLNGCSQEAAFYYLPDGYKDETSAYNGVLIDLINRNSNYDNPKRIFLFKTETIEKTEQKLNEEFKNEQHVVLKGKTSSYDKDSGLSFGFSISTEPNVDISTKSTAIKSNDVQYTGEGNGVVVFTATFKPEPGETYYYRACTFDDIHNNWGEERSFTIEAYTSCPDNHHPHMIDLGLPSGTKWACCNVGASKPEEYGGYFQWGETKTKSSYIWENYAYYNSSTDDFNYIGSDIAGTQYDAATANWGTPWVMPNKEQMEELYNSCTYEWTTENGVNGRRFIGPNGASVFLPAAGERWDDGLYEAGSLGYYWSSTLYESDTLRAWELGFFNFGVGTSDYNRSYGQSVRPVVSSAPVYPNLQLSQTQLSIDKGNSGTVEITSGNDNYTVESSDPSVATATLTGNTITIEALIAGQTTITVTDTQSSQTATIAVTVKEGGSFLEGQIVMTRKLLVHHGGSYNYPEISFGFDNGKLLTLGYYNTGYWMDSYNNSQSGIHIISANTMEHGPFWGVGNPNAQTKDWSISPVILDEWFTEKLIINANGHIQYYLNNKYMGEEVFDDLNLGEASSFQLKIQPYGWWTGHYTYMDDFYLSTPVVTYSDNFNDGIIDLNIWKEPINPDGLREEDGIIKMEQLRTDQDFNLYIENVPLKSGGDIPVYTSCPDNHHPHMIDLGLPSGTKWACCNVGASKPEEYGGYFSWGETAEKSTYNWDTYIYCYDSYNGNCQDIGKDIAGTQYDTATANWGSPWVMPNDEQVDELKNSCTSEWTTENGVNGRRFTGSNGASVFLPAAGSRGEDGLCDAGSDGLYWSSTFYESDSLYWGVRKENARNFYFSSSYVLKNYFDRYDGQSVRPVSKN